MRATAGLAFLIALLGCGPPPTDPAHLAAARDKVWRYTYGQESTPPTIQLITGKDLNCGNGWGFLIEGVKPGDPKRCVAGAYWGAQWRQIQLAVPAAAQSAADLALAHELNHARLEDAGNPPDYNHTDESWQPGGLVARANAALRDAGY